MLGIYAHVPFCVRRCAYCDFFTLTDVSDGARSRLARALVRDLELAAQEGLQPRKVDTLYFGGGTPSRLDPGEIRAVVESVRRLFEWCDPAEVTLEANPEDLQVAHLEALRAAGVNRLSLGVQTLDGATLRALGRLHGEREVHAAARAAREAGFDNLNLDLICGLPGLERSKWVDQLGTLVDRHQPEHLSIYLLDMDKQTPLLGEVDAGRVQLPSDPEVLGAFEGSLELLDTAGYERYEISNFARPGYRCRHNLKYWLDESFLGVGPSAWSYIGGQRWRRVADLEEYLKAIDAGRIPNDSIEPVDPDRRLAEAVIMGLRLRDGIDLEACGRAHGRDAWAVYGERVRHLEEQGWLEQVRGRLRLTDTAMPVANSVWAEFL